VDPKPSLGAVARHELALIVPAKRCCQLTELSAIADAAGGVGSDAGLTLRVTLNTTVRKVVRLARLLHATGDGEHEGHYARGRTSRRPMYSVSLPLSPEVGSLALPAGAAARACCRRALLRGAFLVSGAASLSAAGYQLELILRSRRSAQVMANALRALDCTPRIRARRRGWVVYVKSSDDVARALAGMGASHAVLQLENFRIVREVRGKANRQTNTETANLRRNVATSLRQVAAARALQQTGVIDAQPDAIREMARVRVLMPRASLSEMAERLRLTKSAINQRLRRLEQVALESGLIDSSAGS
jgi:DNA-binding transcriptional regulator WhiA